MAEAALVTTSPDGLEMVGGTPETPEVPTGRLAKLKARFGTKIKWADFLRPPRLYLSLGVIFVLGLVVGWLILGYLLFPIQWTNTDPWDLRPEHQSRYLILVAQDYWRAGDLRRAQQAVEGWDNVKLMRLLQQLQQTAPSAEERQQLAALAEALKVPLPSSSLASLLGQQTIILGLAVAALPLLLAIGFAVLPLLRGKKAATEEELALEELSEEEQAQLAQGEGAPGPGQQGEEGGPQAKKEEEQLLAAQQEEEEQSAVGDILSNLFDDDNPNMERLEALTKGLGDIKVDDLLGLAKELSTGIKRINAQRAGRSGR